VRRTRHRRRFHTDRIARNRRARYRRDTPAWELDRRPRPLPYGLLADRDPWDCGRPGCKFCHWAKRTEPRRARENRAWRRLADGAY
jgi:hypothetical protein